MKVYYVPDELPEAPVGIFLAGPTPRRDKDVPKESHPTTE